MNYKEFVMAKRRHEVATGHQPYELNEHLFDFQHAIVSWAVRRGPTARRTCGPTWAIGRTSRST